MRSSRDSACPNIMVAVVLRFRLWAISMTFNHCWLEHFLGLICLRTESTKISAPPPGMESRPAWMNWRRMVLIDFFSNLLRKTISSGEKAWIWI